MPAQLTFPDDDDGDVLRSLQAKGVDLSKARDVDFYCYVPDPVTADRIMAEMSRMGFDCRPFVSEELAPPEQRLSIYGTKLMVPDYDELIRIQIELNEMLVPYGTHCDGWGTLVDPEVDT